MKVNDESVSTDAAALPETIGRSEIERLLRGQLPFNMAMSLLKQTAEENIDSALLSLFVAVVSETVVETGEKLRSIEGAMDCCGTGGSGLPHFNTSTTVAFVLAAAGVPTAKFGNRAANSLSGSFDLLDRLGIGAALPIEAMPEIFAETGLFFLFAQQFYPSLATIAPVRQVLGAKTIFNLIGPLLNPVRPQLRLIGTPDLKGQELLAKYLQTEEHLQRACVVTSANGLDELEVGETNHVTQVTKEELISDEQYFAPQVADKPWGPIPADECARVFQRLMKNETDENGYYFRTVCLNAGAALHVAGRAADIDAGCNLASELFKQGEVAKKFDQYRSSYARYAK